MFSVIIPMYNSEDTIERALDSLERQTRRDLIREVIVVDDGSNDGSAGRAEEYKNRHGLPVTLLCQKNAGPAAARNAGMRQAAADYIAFLDADDEWERDKLELQAGVLSQNPKIDLLCGGLSDGPLKILIRSHDSLRHVTLKEYCIKSFIYTSTVVIRRERAMEAGYFDESMRYSEDMNYYQRFFRWNQVYYLPRKMASYGKDRAYHGQSGLSSHLKEMHEGRKYDYGVLWKEKQISPWFYAAMLLFGQAKYLRRLLITLIHSRKCKDWED